MKATYSKLVMPNLTGNLRDDVYRFLVDNQCPNTAEHSLRVGAEARRIALQFDAQPESAEAAGYLHDISAVFPNDQRIRVARELGIEVLKEEEEFPMIVHQKLSKVMAKDLFEIEDQEILNAVSCHTTLHKQASLLDQVLFVADKIEWDQAGEPPYLIKILEQLSVSLEHAAFAYIDYLWQQREHLRVVHPWLADAYYELRDNLSVSGS